MPSHRILVTALAACAGLAAQDSFIVGPRALAMGGTGVAVADDQVAQHYNPALFGFFGERDAEGGFLASDNNDLGRKEWGVGIDGNAGFQPHGDLLDLAMTMADLESEDLGQIGIADEEDLADAVVLGSTLPDLGDPGNAVTIDASAGVAVRIGHVAVGARVSGQATVLASHVDLENVTLGVSGTMLAMAINSTGAPTDGTIAAFTPAQSSALVASLGGGPMAVQAVQRLDYEMRRQGLSRSQINNTFVITNNAAQGDGGTLDTNTTAVRMRGFALGEVPVSYGHALGEHLAIGVTVKAMIGRVHGSETVIFRQDADVEVDIDSDEYEQSMNIGLDLGVAWRMPWFQVGVIGRNLNSPTFDGFVADDGSRFASVTVDPQVVVGVALIPRPWVALAVDLDLFEADTTFTGYCTQRLGAGIEFTPGHIVALRAGTYTNLAEDDIGQVVTAGFGVNLWLVRLDLAGAVALDTVEVDGDEIPREARASLGLMSDF